MQRATGTIILALGGYHRMHSLSVPGRQLRCPSKTLGSVVLFWIFASTRCAWAQGVHDWGMWFGTLVVIGAVAALVFILITLVRWLMR